MDSYNQQQQQQPMMQQPVQQPMQQPMMQQQFQQPMQQPMMQQPMQQPYMQQPMMGGMPPARQLKTNRSLAKFILLSMITFGIYGLVVWGGIEEAINTAASPYDGKKTMNFWLLFFLIGPLTCGIGYIVWLHKISNRIGAECQRRGLNYKFSAGDFWLWDVLLSVIIIGPFVYLHKLCKATNLICENYNMRG